jgi:methylated-DNA-protein-cysteine methyltransferase-like protein
LSGQARLVGYALHRLPYGIDVPWHRVVNSKGKISFPSGSHSYQEQRSLLEKEGVMFANERIDLVTYGWGKNPRERREATRR